MVGWVGGVNESKFCPIFFFFKSLAMQIRRRRVWFVQVANGGAQMCSADQDAVLGVWLHRQELLGSGCGDWRESVLFCCPKKLQ